MLHLCVSYFPLNCFPNFRHLWVIKCQMHSIQYRLKLLMLIFFCLICFVLSERFVCISTNQTHQFLTLSSLCSWSVNEQKNFETYTNIPDVMPTQIAIYIKQPKRVKVLRTFWRLVSAKRLVVSCVFKKLNKTGVPVNSMNIF